MCSAIDRPLVIVAPRILSVVRRVIPGRGGGGVTARLLFLSAKKTSSVLARLSVRLLCLAHVRCGIKNEACEICNKPRA